MSRRRAISVEGLHHGGTPIPLASRVGPLLISSGVLGQDPVSGEIPAPVSEQVALVFANVRRILAAGGADVGDVAKLTFFVRDRSARAAIDEHWLAILGGLEPEQAAKGTNLGENAAGEGGARQAADAADRFIARVDIDASSLVIH